METPGESGKPTDELTCSECHTRLVPGGNHVTTEDGAFCRPCFERLTLEIQQALAEQGRDVNYAGALLGGVLGAAVGIGVWWAFTVLTHIAFGLIAVVIGLAVGKGVVLMSGGKRHLNLQIMATVLSVLAFFYASYLVNRSFIAKVLAEQGRTGSLPFFPGPDVFLAVVRIGFGVMDLVFLGIVVYEAWKIPAPVQIAGDVHA
jgi:hypothetical protein